MECSSQQSRGVVGQTVNDLSVCFKKKMKIRSRCYFITLAFQVLSSDPAGRRNTMPTSSMSNA